MYRSIVPVAALLVSAQGFAIDVAGEAEALATGGGPTDRQTGTFSTTGGNPSVDLSATTGSATADLSVSVSTSDGGAVITINHTLDSGPTAVAGASSSGSAEFTLTETTEFLFTGLLEQQSKDPAGGATIRIRNTDTFVVWYQANPNFSLPNNPIDFASILSEGTLEPGNYELTWFHAGNHSISSAQTIATGAFSLILGDAPCVADFDMNGTLNFFDVSAFIAAFVAMDPAADIDGNGIWNFFDVSDYIGLFQAGCP
ncbi:MAG: GC-type dockerin domain-anchored protein [Planctomycetota bacterium]